MPEATERTAATAEVVATESGPPVQPALQGSTLRREMPNAGAMAQVSRPFQIALAAMVLLVGVWFIALHRPGSGSGASGGSAPTGPSSSSSSGAPGASTPVYHGAAPGVEGLTRAIDKAHGAVATSEQNARQLQKKSAQASEAGGGAASTTGAPQTGASAPASHAGAAGTSATTVHHSSAGTTVHRAGAKTYTTTVHTTKGKPGPVSANAVSNAQAAVLQSELKHGQTVLLLFWNPKSTDDASVKKEAQAVAARSHGKVVLHVALPAQVSRYGSVTRGVQVLQTPTLLLIDKRGLAVTMTGLMDQYAIAQGIVEAKHGSAGV
jgi:hypothetical protein